MYSITKHPAPPSTILGSPYLRKLPKGCSLGQGNKRGFGYGPRVYLRQTKGPTLHRGCS